MTGTPTSRPLTPAARLRRWLSADTTSSVPLLVAALIGLLWANSPWRHAYASLAGLTVGPAAWHLDLTVSDWAADGLLAIFFFAVGVELKHEAVAGSLRRFREAAVPVLAAVGGMVVPAAIFVAVVVLGGAPSALHGWAIPTSTDIAFSLAVLAVAGRGLPRALRMFLLTLAVADDLLGIVVIAAFYASGIHPAALAGTLACAALFGWLVRARRPRWWLLTPVALVAWVLMHASGVHPTIAGVLLGLTVPAQARYGEELPRTIAAQQAIGPWSAGVALPLFAFFSAGVPLRDGPGVVEVLTQPVVPAIVAGLVIGKPLGVLVTTALVTRFTPFRLPNAIGLRDLIPVGLLTGIGFTVSLLIARLSFPDSEHTAGATIAVLAGSVLAAILGAAMLRRDARRARTRDMNLDGVPDRDAGRIGDD